FQPIRNAGANPNPRAPHPPDPRPGSVRIQAGRRTLRLQPWGPGRAPESGRGGVLSSQPRHPRVAPPPAEASGSATRHGDPRDPPPPFRRTTARASPCSAPAPRGPETRVVPVAHGGLPGTGPPVHPDAG